MKFDLVNAVGTKVLALLAKGDTITPDTAWTLKLLTALSADGDTTTEAAWASYAAAAITFGAPSGGGFVVASNSLVEWTAGELWSGITHAMISGDVNGDLAYARFDAEYAVAAVSTGAKTFSIAGDYHTLFAAGTPIEISGSTGNDGVYTVAAGGATYSAPNTVIPVNETVASATADGSLQGPSPITIPSGRKLRIPIGNLSVTLAGAYTSVSAPLLLNTLFRGSAWTPLPASPYVSVYHDLTTELTGYAYGRKQVDFDTPADSETANTSDELWTAASGGNWVQGNYFGLHDAGTAGNCHYLGPLDSAVTVAAGESLEVVAGALKFRAR